MGLNFIFEFLNSTLIFSKFYPKICFKLLCHGIFFRMFAPKFIIFYLLFFINFVI